MAPWLFSKAPKAPPPPPPPAPVPLSQQIRQNQRQIDKACRELDRERIKMEMQEKNVKTQIKKLAKGSQLDAARIMAKDLVRTRHHITRTYQMRTQLQSVSMQLSTMRTNEAMSSAMGNVVQVMAKMNQSMNLPAMQQVLMQFEMEHGKMEMTQEMMDDAMGDVLGADNEEEQTDEIINQVMDELGLENETKMNAVTSANANPTHGVAAEDPGLQARLNALQK